MYDLSYKTGQHWYIMKYSFHWKADDVIDFVSRKRADSRSKKDYNSAACGRETTFTER